MDLLANKFQDENMVLFIIILGYLSDVQEIGKKNIIISLGERILMYFTFFVLPITVGILSVIFS